MYSIVVPVYGNEATLPDMVRRLESLAAELPVPVEGVFVVDGSPDNSYAVLKKELGKSKLRSELVRLSRNFGSFAAIRMGMSIARGPYFAVMAADLQEPAELYPRFLEALQSGEVDVAVGSRVSRSDPFLSRLSSGIFWRLYRRIVQRETPPGGIDVFACTREVRDVLLELRESNSTLVGLLLWMGYRRTTVPYHRQPRPSGKSGWSFPRKLRYMLDSMYAFSDLPIQLLVLVGAMGVAGSLLLSLVVFLAWVFGAIAVKGYTPQILAVLFSTSLILFSIGVLGGYVWRAFENTKGRPEYIPLSRESFNTEEDA